MNPRGNGKADPAQTRLVQELKHNSPLIACRFDPSGRFVLGACQDNTVQRWELANGQKTSLIGHTSWVRALAGQPGGELLITADYRGQMFWWRTAAETPTPLRAVEAHRGWVRAVAVSPDGRLLATGGNDNLVKLWSAHDGKPLRAFAGHANHVYNVAFHPDGRSLVSGDLKGVLKQWDLTTGKAVRDLDAGPLYKYDETFLVDFGGPRSLEFSPDGALLACAGITNQTNALAGVGTPGVVLFDAKSGQRKQVLVPKDDFSGTAWRAVFHPDGFLVGAGSGRVKGNGALWFWKPDEAAAFASLKLPTNARDMDLHPDGRRLAVAFYDDSVRIYDMGPKAGG